MIVELFLFRQCLIVKLILPSVNWLLLQFQLAHFILLFFPNPHYYFKIKTLTLLPSLILPLVAENFIILNHFLLRNQKFHSDLSLLFNLFKNIINQDNVSHRRSLIMQLEFHIPTYRILVLSLFLDHATYRYSNDRSTQINYHC